MGGMTFPDGEWGMGEHLSVAIVILVAVLVLVVLVFFLVPFIVLLLGVLAATLALAARLLGVSAWTVRAQAGKRTLVWRVRGVLKSGRTMRSVAAMLERGEDTLVDGRPSTVVDAAPV